MHSAMRLDAKTVLEEFDDRGFVVVASVLDPIIAEYEDVLGRLAEDLYRHDEIDFRYEELPFEERLLPLYRDKEDPGMGTNSAGTCQGAARTAGPRPPVAPLVRLEQGAVDPQRGDLFARLWRVRGHALASRLHQVLIANTMQDHLVGHVSHDATAIEGREKATPKPPQPIQPKRQRGGRARARNERRRSPAVWNTSRP